jgi:hypothetical protein
MKNGISMGGYDGFHSPIVMGVSQKWMVYEGQSQKNDVKWMICGNPIF